MIAYTRSFSHTALQQEKTKLAAQETRRRKVREIGQPFTTIPWSRVQRALTYLKDQGGASITERQLIIALDKTARAPGGGGQSRRIKPEVVEIVKKHGRGDTEVLARALGYAWKNEKEKEARLIKARRLRQRVADQEMFGAPGN
jgi:hypothetical protein